MHPSVSVGTRVKSSSFVSLWCPVCCHRRSSSSRRPKSRLRRERGIWGARVDAQHSRLTTHRVLVVIFRRLLQCRRHFDQWGQNIFPVDSSRRSEWSRDSTPISDYRRRERCSSDHRRDIEPGSTRYSSAPSITTVWSNYQTSYNDFFEVYITETVTYHLMVVSTNSAV